MLKRFIPFQIALLCATMVGCTDDPIVENLGKIQSQDNVSEVNLEGPAMSPADAGHGNSTAGDDSADFQVLAYSSEMDASQKLLGVVPPILAFKLIGYAGLDHHQVFDIQSLESGARVDLSALPADRVNVMAVSADQTRTGSVHFLLEGPVSIDRWENHAIYTLAIEPQGLGINSGDLPPGEYRLSATGYQLPNLEGEQGTTTTVSFTVTGTAEDTRATTGLPDDAVLELEDDEFTLAPGDEKSFSVSLNDTYVKGAAQFEVLHYPSHGEVVMDDEGAIFYYAHNDKAVSDSFVYQARQGTDVQQARVTVKVVAPEDASLLGFTAITPSADSRIIYVSSSQGDDTNDCLSPDSPCASLAAAFDKARADMPDHVYLKRGDVWSNEKLNDLKSGRSKEEPAVVAFYGESGDRPKVQNRSNVIHISNDRSVVKNLHIIGLHFDAYKMDPARDAFTGVNEDHSNLVFLLDNEDILLEDNIFNYLEVVIQRFEEKSPKNFTLRRNIWTGAYGDTSSTSQKKRPSNIYAAGVDGLIIEDNVFDYGGWNPEAKGAAGNMYNHNLYLQASNNGNRVVVRNNIITRGSSHGVQMRAGGLAEDNFLARNAVGLLIGYSQVPLKEGVKAHAINNVITEGASMVKGDAPCSGDNLCSPARYGLHFDINGDADWRAQGNIVHSTEESDTTWEKEFNGLVTRAFEGIDDPEVVASDNKQADWGSKILDGVAESARQGLTLGDYYLELEQLGALAQDYEGEDNFDKFMNMVKTRPLQQWDELHTARSINSYIRAGFKH